MSTTAAMREVRRKQMNSEITEKAPKKPAKRKSPAKTIRTHEQNNNAVKRMRTNENTKDDMLTVYQPWVIQTYGDLAKTKTVTLKKYARILRTLRGDEIASADNSKFRFWVKAKGFCVGKPPGYDCKPADGIVGRYSVCDADVGIPPVDDKLEGSAKDPPLYVPNVSFKNSTGEPVYRKVAVVENFFDIIYNVHVDLEGRPGKHAGQKRTYRTITETYAFLPREAVTRFLLGCTECQKRPRSPSPPTPVLPTPSPSPTLPAAPHVAPQTVPQQLSASLNVSLTSVVTSTTNIGSGAPFVLQQLQQDNKRGGCVQDTGLGIERTFCTNIAQGQSEFQERPTLATPNAAVRKTTHPLDVSNLTSRDDVRPGDGEKKPADAAATTAAPKLWSPVKSIEEEQSRCVQEEQRCLRPKTMFLPGDIDYSMPITSTYLKYMRSLGCGKDEALDFDNKHENLPTPESSEGNDDDTYNGSGALKDNDKLKLMLLAWNYQNQAQGNKNGGSDIPDLSSMSGGEEMAGLWAQYHSAMGLSKGKATPPTIRDQSSPVNAETGSAHDETSSSGNKDDEDDDDDESDDKIDTQTRDPERLKAFNMFVRLFVDENLDRMVPISKQPKEKIQAIIDSCTRQFPEFAERARKRIRTYLKSCRRNKRARDPNSPWDASRPTPAHLTSVQAEQILASACENESHNAKRMRLGLEPVSQPMPVLPGVQTTDTTASISTRGLEFINCPPIKLENDVVSTTFPSSTTPSSTSNSITKGPLTPDIKPSISATNSLATSTMNGIGISSTAGSAPTAMYRPNFSQAFQRAGPYPLFPGTPFGTSSSLLTNGPADLSIKQQKPLVNHKLNTGEMAAVRQLITGYRESAAFLLRSADELEQLLLQQQ